MLPMQLKLSAILSLTLVVIFALAATNYWSYSKGYSNASTLHERNAKQREAELLQQVTDAQTALLDAERSHTATVAEIQAGYEIASREAAAANAAVIADLRSSQRRVRIPVTDCLAEPVPEAKPATSADHGAGTAELDPQVAARIWAIAADGDRAAQKLTALQSWAREAVRLCNGNHQPGRQ